MSKTLYFEGAGWSGANAEYNGLNCRIRTAFHNNDDKKIYLELNGCHPLKEHLKEAKKNKVTLPSTYMYIDCAEYITDDPTIDDCNESRIYTIPYEEMRKIEYSLENIRDFVNTHFNCSFDSVVILYDLSGYRVFSSKPRKGWGTSDQFYFGDCFDYDEELEKKREQVYDYFYQLEKAEGKQYPNFSLWVDEFDKKALHLLRHFSGTFKTAHNTHWIIRLDERDDENNRDWTMTESFLGKYGC